MRRAYEVKRTRFGSIVSEYVAPARKSNKVVILCAGAPSYPGKRTNVMTFFAKKGYWVFLPRYRGTWESDGEFLKHSPHLDIISVMNGVAKGFVGAWSEKKIRIANPRYYLLGSSFGGSAAILASLDKRVVKAVAISPVIDWSKQKGTKEPLDFLDRFVPFAFGNAYRANRNIWKKLEKGKLYAPMSAIDRIDGSKLMLIHAKDDDVVPFSPTHTFAERTSSSFIGVRTGGHMGSGSLIRSRFWKKIEPFLKARTISSHMRDV